MYLFVWFYKEGVGALLPPSPWSIPQVENGAHFTAPFEVTVVVRVASATLSIALHEE